MIAKWGDYGEAGQCPNCSAMGFFGAEDRYWIYPIAGSNYPPKSEDYLNPNNWRCWNCSK